MNWIATYWLEVLFGGVLTVFSTLFGFMLKREKARRLEQAKMKEGILAMLHDRLYQSCRHYLHEEEIDVDALKNIEYLYESYHDLGGNGTGTELYERVKDLPFKHKEVI